MLHLRPSEARGHANFGWLDSRHSFSFGQYHDPAHMGFGPLRVINEDRVAPGAGFDTHGHADMEIITWVLDGALEHKDSLGTGSVIRPGDLQIMSAGTGVRHSEFNASKSDPVHFLQIWIIPATRGLEPGYDQRSFSEQGRHNGLQLLVSGSPGDGSLLVHRDVDLYASQLDKDAALTFSPEPGRKQWLQLVSGELDVNDEQLRGGDGLAIADEAEIVITALDGSAFLLFDMA